MVYAVCVCHPSEPCHPPRASPPIDKPAMERSRLCVGRSNGLNAADSALTTEPWEPEENDAVEPCEKWPTVRFGTSATLVRRAGGGEAGLIGSSAGGVGVPLSSGSVDSGSGGSSVSVEMLSRKPRDRGAGASSAVAAASAALNAAVSRGSTEFSSCGGAGAGAGAGVLCASCSSSRSSWNPPISASAKALCVTAVGEVLLPKANASSLNEGTV